MIVRFVVTILLLLDPYNELGLIVVVLNLLDFLMLLVLIVRNTMYTMLGDNVEHTFLIALS